MRLLFKIFPVAVLLSLPFGSSIAQNHDPIVFEAKMELLDAWITTQMDHEQIPGMSISIFNRDSILWENGYGYSNMETKTKITPQTPLRTCSISKLFTALQVMQLHQNGLLNVEAPLSALLPDFNPVIDNQFPISSVSLKNVLTHTSGLPTEANMPYFINFKYPTSDELINDINAKKLLSQPDSMFRYSNLGYSIAGLAVEQVTGKGFNEAVQQHIIQPLGLSNTFADISQMQNVDHLAKGYGVRMSTGREVFEHYDTKALSPAAGAISSSHDLAIFGNWVFNVSNQSDDLFHSEIINSMSEPAWTDSSSGYERGLGFRYYYDGDRTYFGHGGYCSGYRAVLMMDQKTKTGVSVLMNVNDYSPYDVAYTILGLIKLEIEYNQAPTNNDLSKFRGIYDRSNMPIRSVITSLPDRLLVMNLFSTRPDHDIWVLTPNESNSMFFDKQGIPLREISISLIKKVRVRCAFSDSIII